MINKDQLAEHTPQSVYEPYVLQVIRDANGPIEIGTIHAETRKRMQHILLPGDFLPAILDGKTPELVGKKKERFGHYVSWVLTQLKKEGKIINVRRGIWEIVK